MLKKNKRKVILATLIILLVAYYFCLPRQLFRVPYSTVVTDRHGQLLGARIADDGQWRFPACDTVPEKFKICLTNFEDRHFYHHRGVNPLSLVRAIIQNIKEKRVVSGGSTLTMQIIRLSRNKKRTVREKSIEAILATRLEFRYSKEKILALYASYAPFGGNVVGLDAAAWRYFGHPADRLSWAETATLAVLPNAPSLLHLAKNREALLQKRNRLLKMLFDRKIFDETTYELALGENLPGEPLPLPQTAPHLVSWFYKNSPGKNCTSTIDKDLQIRVENVLERWNCEFRQNDIRNIAAIVIDVKTNQPIAYCGNVRFRDDDAGNQVDVIQAERSTGSILKPFLYYAMLQEGDILPKTLLPDIQININGFSPQNFNLQYEGAVHADEAVSRSLNVPLVYLLRKYGVPKFYNFLKQNHIAALPKPSGHYGLSLILGGAEANLGDLANAYSNMARSLLNLELGKVCVISRSRHCERSEAIQKDVDNQLDCFGLCPRNDEQKKQTSHYNTPFTKYNPAAVWQVFTALTEVNRPEQIDWKAIPSMQKIAWKTGTSYGFRDAWAIGVTPKYVVGVWAGNASGEGRPGLTGAKTAGPVMFDIFELLPASPWFEQPMGQFVEAEVCPRSGYLKSRFCEDADTVLVCPNGLRTDPCPFHTIVNLTADEKFRIYETCVEAGTSIRKSWFVLPPAWAWYYKQHHPGYKSLPPLKPGCGEGNYQPMQFIYPQGNAKISPSRQLDGTTGEITFELAHNHPNAVVFWHIDNEYIASTTDFHKLSVRLMPGIHSITVVDNEGNSLSCRIEVVN